MSPSQRLPLDTTPGGIQRLYYRILLGAVATVLVVQLVLQLVFGTGPAISIQLMGLYAAILLLSWLGYETVRDREDRGQEPKGWVLGTLSLLLVVLCVETGGLASPYYMLLFTTCVFGALLMSPSKAFLLTSVAALAYCATTWLYPTNGRILTGGLRGLFDTVMTGPRAKASDASALVIHSGFLFLGTFIASRLAGGFREQVTRLERSSTRDPLTKLPNRRGFMDKLRLEIDRVVQWDWPLAILVTDLDHFKKVNDCFGHNVGDEVLVEAAKLLRDVAGPLDHVARLGGEEFGVAGVGADRRHGADIADRIVRAFRNHPWHRIHPDLEEVTCSVGVAVCHPSRDETPMEDFATLIAAADAALMRVKGANRNGYLVAGDIPEPTAKGPLVVPRPPGENDPRQRRPRMIRR